MKSSSIEPAIAELGVVNIHFRTQARAKSQLPEKAKVLAGWQEGGTGPITTVDVRFLTDGVYQSKLPFSWIERYVKQVPGEAYTPGELTRNPLQSLCEQFKVESGRC